MKNKVGNRTTTSDEKKKSWIDLQFEFDIPRCIMSNRNNNNNNNIAPPHDYEFVKTLVRDLHMTRNVSRPDEFNRSTTNKATRAAIHMSDAEKLLFNRLDDNNCQSSVSDIDDSYNNEGDDISRSSDKRDIAKSQLALTNNDILKKNASSTHHQSNCSLNIPSVVITDANEHIDLFSSTQRRFSQLYSGLRRFSTSHTVWTTNGMRFYGFYAFFFFFSLLELLLAKTRK